MVVWPDDVVGQHLLKHRSALESFGSQGFPVLTGIQHSRALATQPPRVLQPGELHPGMKVEPQDPLRKEVDFFAGRQHYAYVIPGVITWIGILMTGAYPTLADVVLGMMTPVVAMPMRERPLDAIAQFSGELIGHAKAPEQDASDLMAPLKRLRLAQRELLPPVVRVQSALHPWVAYAIMPLFALANAGVNLGGIDLSSEAPHWVMLGIGIALVAGKPLGVLSVSWLMVRLGWCTLPAGVSWSGITLIGLLAGIGFTMSIFIATLAFADASLLGAAKVGVLSGSVISAVLGIAWGVLKVRRTHPGTSAKAA